MVNVSVIIDLPFRHMCKNCDHFYMEYVSAKRKATRLEKFIDFLADNEIRKERTLVTIPYYCAKKKQVVVIDAKEPCFEWSGSHEEWLPDISACIKGGKIAVKFGEFGDYTYVVDEMKK